MAAATTDREQPVVDDRLCLALHTAARAMTARYRPVLEGLGLTYPQYLVMALLWQEGELSAGAVADRLHLDPSTLSPVLRRLESAGLLERRRAAHDDRVVNVRCTRRGTALRSRAAQVPQQICDATELTPQRQAALVRQLQRLAAALEPAAAG